MRAVLVTAAAAELAAGSAFWMHDAQAIRLEKSLADIPRGAACCSPT
jgi:hypothetical protein